MDTMKNTQISGKPRDAPGHSIPVDHAARRHSVALQFATPFRTFAREIAMSEHVYKKIEITGSSSESSDQAVRNAIARAAETVKNIDWFEIVETRGQVADKQLKFWQVTVKLGFRLED